MNGFDVIAMERWFYLLGFIVCLSLLFYQWFRSWQQRQVQLKRLKRGKQLEQEARRFLTGKGFHILGEQVEISHDYEVNGEPHSSIIVLDYLVRKRGKIYIVEVKSGASATSIQNGGTRRQILEYDFVLKNDGIFLLDMEHHEMHLVKFFPKETPVRIRWFFILLFFAFVGIWLPFLNVKLVISMVLLFMLFFYKKIII